MSTHQDDDEIVMVPVPKRLLMTVYAAMAEAGAKSDRAEETVVIPAQGTLTAAEVGRLKSALVNPALRAFLARLAEQAPKELTFREAVQASGIESNMLRAQLGSLSKISKRVLERTVWPMSVRYADGGEAVYSMPAKVAEWWLEAADH